jgi:hypothetical protein
MNHLVLQLTSYSLALSLLVFLTTTVLWLFFSKPYKVAHYTSLTVAAVAHFVWVASLVMADSVYIARPRCLPDTSNVEEFVFALVLCTSLYSFIGLLVVIIRKRQKKLAKTLTLICVPLFLLATLYMVVYTKILEKQERDCMERITYPPFMQR